MSFCQCLPTCDALQGVNGKTGGGLPEGSVQVLIAMMGQDMLMNATQQQMVRVSVAWLPCCILQSAFAAAQVQASIIRLTEQCAKTMCLTGQIMRQIKHQASKRPAYTQVYLHDNGTVSNVVSELSCPAAEEDAGLLPAFVAQMPAQETQPGQGPCQNAPQCTPIPSECQKDCFVP